MALKPVKVGQLNRYIGTVLKSDPIISNVSVIGEVSNINFHSSGHIYFSLKDESSKINCFLSKNNKSFLTFTPYNGMEVIASGNVSVFERGGYYSLNVKMLEVNGTGQLAEQFEKLKSRLEAEGLFDSSVKKAIPAFPEKVAIVTSDTGAAISDIIRTIKNKNDYVDILVCPVLVQGSGAAESIAEALNYINSSHREVSVIITGRGGGSMEELWAFNEELVARSIYNSEIPVISAVGHERDFTIADFVSDLRAATPTAAAEAAVPDTQELRNYIDELRIKAENDLLKGIAIDERIVESLNPEFFARNVRTRIDYENQHIEGLKEDLLLQIEKGIKSRLHRAGMLKDVIETANPKSVMARGYSIVTDADGRIISSTEGLAAGNKVSIETWKGHAEAEITKVYNGGTRNGRKEIDI